MHNILHFEPLRQVPWLFLLVLMLTFVSSGTDGVLDHSHRTAQPITAQLLVTDSWRLYLIL